MLPDEGRTLDLPRQRSPPTINVVTDIAAYLSFTIWKNGVDDGSGDFRITGYDIQIWSEVNSTWTSWRHLPLASIPSQSQQIKGTVLHDRLKIKCTKLEKALEYIYYCHTQKKVKLKLSYAELDKGGKVE